MTDLLENTTEETELTPQEHLTTSLKTLAQTRDSIEKKVKELSDREELLAGIAPEMVTAINEITQELVELRKTQKELETDIRNVAVQFPEVAKAIPWLPPRSTTVVEVPDAFALEIARVFCPSAITIDRKIFDKWAIANYPNPLLPIVVKKLAGFTIKSDLSKLLDK